MAALRFGSFLDICCTENTIFLRQDQKKMNCHCITFIYIIQHLYSILSQVVRRAPSYLEFSIRNLQRIEIPSVARSNQ